MEQLPEFPSFRDLGLNDKPQLDSLLKDMQPQISELTFTNLFVWSMSEPVQLSRLGETAVLQRRRLRDGNTFIMPLLIRRSFDDMLDELKASNLHSRTVLPIYGVTAKQAQELAQRGATIEPDRDDWDYVYLTSDLADLPGDKYHPKRNFISRCLAKHDCKYAPIGTSEINDCLHLQTTWCSLRDCSMIPGLEAENRAIRTVFDNYERLTITGGAVYVDDKLEAFTLAERLNDETAVIHFEKANQEIDGLYQVINQWFCQNALRNFRFVNREQDLGIPGLRKAKMSYHPDHMVEKYIMQV